MALSRPAKTQAALTAIASGDPLVAEDLLPLVYDELRELAHRRLARERAGTPLQTTELVHEAYLRLIGDEVSWDNRGHFFAAAARAMRRILIEHARHRGRIKHGAGRKRVPLEDGPAVLDSDPNDMLALDDLLTRLEHIDRRKSDVVHLRYFAGLSVEDVARVLGVSVRTVESEWRFARAWLYGRLRSGDVSDGEES